MALKLHHNGVTVCAVGDKDDFLENQIHSLNGEEYHVVLSKRELQILLLKGNIKPNRIVTTFIDDMSHLFTNKNIGA